MVAIGVPVAAAVAARLALRRVNISPLGVARRVTPKPPRAWRVVPLLAGLAELGFWDRARRTRPPSRGQIQAFVTSFPLIIVGLFIAGPWLTMAAARVMARWTSRPGTLIAARRIGDDPRAAFRAVSGLVLALLVTTVAVVAITTQDAKDPTRFGSVAESHVLTDQMADQVPAQQPGAVRHGKPGTGRARRAARRPAERGSRRPGGGRGPRGPGADHPRDTFRTSASVRVGPAAAPVPAGVVSCAQLATVPALGRCPAGAATAAFPADGFNGPLFSSNATGITWPAANVPAAGWTALGVDAINVATNGAVPAVEQARTLLENARAYPPSTRRPRSAT